MLQLSRDLRGAARDTINTTTDPCDPVPALNSWEPVLSVYCAFSRYMDPAARGGGSGVYDPAPLLRRILLAHL